MNFLSYLRVELSRIFLSRMTWMVMLLTLLAPLVGYGLYQPSTQLAVTRSGEFIGNPTLAGAVGGVILFALLTLFELDRVHKSGSDKLTDTIVSPVTMYLTRMLSVLAVATSTGILATVIYLPYTLYKVGYLFDWTTYWGCWLLIFLPALWTGTLLAAVFYQITRRFDMSLVLVIFASLFCFMPTMHYEFILRWINPDIQFLSDMFGNAQPLRMTAYNRIFWVAALAGVYVITNLCVRRYGQGVLGSFFTNSKKFYKPMLGVTCIVLATGLYAGQPFVSSAVPVTDRDLLRKLVEISTPMELAARVSSIHTLVEPNIKAGTMHAVTTWKFVGMEPNWQGKTTENALTAEDGSLYYRIATQINSGLEIYSIDLDSKTLDFSVLPGELWNSRIVVFDMPYSYPEEIALTIEYGGYLKIWRSDENSGSLGSVISSQYVFLGTDDLQGGIPLDLWPLQGETLGNPTDVRMSAVDIILPENMVAINYYYYIFHVAYPDGSPAPGKPFLISENGDGTKTWRYLSRYNTAYDLYAAEYLSEKIETEGVKIDFYYAAKNRDAIIKYNVFETIKEVYDYCSRTISSQPPSDIVLIQQLDVSEVEFSEDSLAAQWKPASGQNTMAYQVIEDWWSEMEFRLQPESNLEEIAKEMMEEIQGNAVLGSEWGRSGITEYIAYRFAKEKFGEEYAMENYVKVWKNKVNDLNRNFYIRNPEYKDMLPQSASNLLTQRQQQVISYYTMPLKIWKAAQLVGGEDNMDEIIAQIYKDAYTNRLFVPSVSVFNQTYEEYLDMLKGSTGQSRPMGAADEHLRSLYMMWSGQQPIPVMRHQFLEQVNMDNILAESSLKRDDLLAKTMTSLYNSIVRRYDVGPMMYYTDFLKTCGLTDADLELTEEDFKI